MTSLVTEALDERLVGAAIQALELHSIHIGRALGLYAHLVEPRTVDEFAQMSWIDPRYAREWLEQQAVAGFVTVDDMREECWNRRRYRLDEHQRAVLLTPDDPAHAAPLADMVAGVGAVLDRVVDAFRTGDGVPYAEYGGAFRDGQAGINRPAFTHDLVGEWLGAVPDVVARLATGGNVADLGCGAGWSTIALARAFPRASVVGYDDDEGSIADARRNAAGTDVIFERADATALVEDGPFDLVVILEALHDMAHPVRVLDAARRSLAPGGAVLVADERVAAAFTAPGDDLERMMYGWSVVHCLPAALVEPDSAALGTVVREGMIHELAGDAGFGHVETSEIDAGFFRLYVLR